MPQIWISLGSNQEREQNLRTAIAALRKRYGDLHLSAVYESAAVGFVGAPFYNLVAGYKTEDSPQQIVATLRTIEATCGRVRGAAKFAARTLDLDLLTWGNLVLNQDGIMLPRDEIVKYAFVLRPLAEVAGQELHPLLNQTYRELWDNFDVTAQPLQLVNVPLHPLLRYNYD